MIVVEHPVIMGDGSENYGLIKQYSDLNVFIRQIETGDEYSEAIDIYPCPYTYEETDRPIDEPEQPEEEEEQLDEIVESTD